MNKRVELKVRYENGNEIHIVAEQGVIDGKPALWKVSESKRNLETTEEKLHSVELANSLRREIAQYFGIKYD